MINGEYPKTYPFSKRKDLGMNTFPEKNLYVIINTRGEEISTELGIFHLKDVYGYGAISHGLRFGL